MSAGSARRRGKRECLGLGCWWRSSVFPIGLAAVILGGYFLLGPGGHPHCARTSRVLHLAPADRPNLLVGFLAGLGP